MQEIEINTVADLIKYLSGFDQNLKVYKYETVLSDFFPLMQNDISIGKLCKISKDGDEYDYVEESVCQEELAKELVEKESYRIIESFDAVIL